MIKEKIYKGNHFRHRQNQLNLTYVFLNFQLLELDELRPSSLEVKSATALVNFAIVGGAHE